MSRVVFIGNIPYDLSETQIIEIFNEVGIVQSFRLVFDRETGKPKGYGFCTYSDHETAASAVRNLNNYDINGRTLRVDFAESDKDDAPNKESFNTGRSGRDDYGSGSRDPRERTFSENQPTNSVQTITNIVKGMDPQQLAEVLAYLKVMVQNSPEQAATLLSQNPQLSFGVFQALITMNLVDAVSMQKILQAHPQGYQGPLAQQPMAPPQQAAPPHMAAQLQLEQQQKQLVMQLMNLTPEQIQALPADQQQQVLLVRAQLLQGAQPR